MIYIFVNQNKIKTEAIVDAFETSTSFSSYPINSAYGERTDPITGESSFHNGIDYALPLNTEVNANVAGTVVTSEYHNSFGNYVVVKDGTGKMHYYAHLNERNVNVGDSVSVGDSLGLSGSTGRSTGAHLHYEVRENNKSINPISNGAEIGLGVTIPEYSWSITDKIKGVILNIFKFIIIALLIILFVVFITKALDISII